MKHGSGELSSYSCLFNHQHMVVVETSLYVTPHWKRMLQYLLRALWYRMPITVKFWNKIFSPKCKMEPKEEKKKGKKKKKAFLYFVQVNVRVPFSSSDAYQKGDWDFPCFALLLLTLRFPGQELSISWCFLFFFCESWSSVHSKHNNTAQYSNNKITYIQICYMLDECISSKLKQLWCRCLPPSKCLAYHYGLKRSSCYSNWRKTSDFSSFEGGKSHPSLYWPCLVFFHLLARDPRWFAQVRLLTL